jgi:hypothetical protein
VFFFSLFKKWIKPKKRAIIGNVHLEKKIKTSSAIACWLSSHPVELENPETACIENVF